MSGPERRTVRVRRSPRIGVFLAVGAALGVLVALVAVLALPVAEEVTTTQAFGFLLLLFAPAGGLLGGLVAILLDAVSERRSRTTQAERDAGPLMGPGGDVAERDDPDGPAEEL